MIVRQETFFSHKQFYSERIQQIGIRAVDELARAENSVLNMIA